jgi:hypothetical protein
MSLHVEGLAQEAVFSFIHWLQIQIEIDRIHQQHSFYLKMSDPLVLPPD